MSDLTVRHFTAKIPIQMPASTQADGDPGYTPADAIDVLDERRRLSIDALNRAYFRLVLAR